MAQITINGNDKRNAMNHAFFAELSATLAAFDDDPGVRAYVLTGAAAAFSAGGDSADFDRPTDTAS